MSLLASLEMVCFGVAITAVATFAQPLSAPLPRWFSAWRARSDARLARGYDRWSEPLPPISAFLPPPAPMRPFFRRFGVELLRSTPFIVFLALVGLGSQPILATGG